MAVVGNWGVGIIFKVSEDWWYTFSNMQVDGSGRWAQHQIFGEKPRSEFLGPDQTTISMDVTLSAYGGVQPRVVLEALERARDTGRVEWLFIGGKKVSPNKFYLSSVSATWSEVWNMGELVTAKVALEFGEYL